MNILEKYIEIHGQFILMILGLPCTSKSLIAKEFEIDLKLPIINLNDYLEPNKFKIITVDNKKFEISEDTENYNWKKLIKDVNLVKSSGVILYGNYIDIEQIDFNIDFSFFYSMNNTLCKKILGEKKIIDWKDSSGDPDLFYDKIFVPFYDKLKISVKFNKFFNVKEETKFEDQYNDVFDLLMEFIKKKI